MGSGPPVPPQDPHIHSLSGTFVIRQQQNQGFSVSFLPACIIAYVQGLLLDYMGELDLADLFTKNFTLNRQDRNQVRCNICAGILWRTPLSEVVIYTEQSGDLFGNKMAQHWLHVLKYLYRFIFTPEYSKVPSFTCFRWVFWLAPSTLRASTPENLSSGFANNTGTDQPAHLRNLISTFIKSQISFF